MNCKISVIQNVQRHKIEIPTRCHLKMYFSYSKSTFLCHWCLFSFSVWVETVHPQPVKGAEFVPPASFFVPPHQPFTPLPPSLHCNHDDRRVLPPAWLSVWLCQQHGPMEKRGGGERRRLPSALRHPGHSHRWTVVVLCAQTHGCPEVRLVLALSRFVFISWAVCTFPTVCCIHIIYEEPSVCGATRWKSSSIHFDTHICVSSNCGL